MILRRPVAICSGRLQDTMQLTARGDHFLPSLWEAQLVFAAVSQYHVVTLSGEHWESILARTARSGFAWWATTQEVATGAGGIANRR